MKFKIEKKSKTSRARLGVLETKHGVIETPAFIPVATQGTLKTLSAKEAKSSGCQALIANTFHLHLKPGEDIVKKAGGLHEFMNWEKPLMTDSGGFQVFSLGFGRDHGVGKILKAKRDEVVELGQQPKQVEITDDGAWFKSPVDGARLFIGPKKSIKIQEQLGADIIFVFDEATSPVADEAYTKLSLERTHRWAKQCLKFKKSDQALFGIVQGGKYKNLRIESARFLSTLDFPGFGIGGEYGDEKSTMINMLEVVMKELPEEKPRHLLGIGHVEDMEEIIKSGVDTFDCIAPTHYGRHGVAFTSEGKINFKRAIYLTDQNPVDKNCNCFVCQNYKRSFITHLFRAKEISGMRYLAYHNLYFMNKYVKKLRQKIKNGNL